MTLILLRYLRSLYRLIISETAPLSIAAGLAAGCVLGLTPLSAPHNLLIAMAILLLRVNLGAALFSMGVFKLLGALLWGAFHELGLSLLTNPGLEGLWRGLVYTPGPSYLRLNNTQILGSLTVALLLAPLVLLGGLGFVRHARAVLTEKRANHWLVRWTSSSRILAYLARWA